MNFQLVILFAVAVCALALPVPDEEVSSALDAAKDVVQKAKDVAQEAVTSVEELVKSEPSLITMEEGASAVVGNATVENLLKPIESELEKPTERLTETVSVAEDDIKEVPKSLPVVAQKGTEAVVPPFAGVRAEPKEGVEIAEAKSTASSPGADEIANKSEQKAAEEVKPTTESNAPAPVEKKAETPTTEELPKPEATSSTKPAVAEENKTKDSGPKKTDKSSAKSKPTELGKEKHDHSADGNKSEESAESKESEESDESNKSK